MKIAALLISLSMLSNAALGTDISSLAPVSETHFRIFGKGIRNSETGDHLALVCAQIDQIYHHSLRNPCNAMRFIYFKSGSPIAYYLSDKLIPGAYLHYRQDEGTRAFWGVNPNQVSFDEPNTDALIEHAAQTVIKRLSLSASHAKVASNAVVDRNGWGWSAKPISVNAKYFDDLTRNIHLIYTTRLPSDHPYAGMILLSK